jgi:hypothetical protein
MVFPDVFPGQPVAMTRDGRPVEPIPAGQVATSEDFSRQVRGLVHAVESAAAGPRAPENMPVEATPEAEGRTSDVE